MRRRSLLQYGAALLVWPRLVQGQAARRFRVAFLYFGDEGSAKAGEEALLAGLRDIGYVLGQDLTVDTRYARGDTSSLPALADELIARKPDVLIAIEPEASLLRTRTKTIPIVLPASTDPVAAGLVESLARPGTNVTGLAYRNDELLAKHIELVTEIRPNMSRLALFNKIPLDNSSDQRLVARFEQVARKAAAAKGLTLVVVRARDAEGVRQAFGQLEKQRPEAIVVAATGATFQLRHEIISQIRRLRLPSISSLPLAWLEAGGMVNYGPNFRDSYRYAATFVDRILKGAKPAELPIEQPAKFELAINLKAARELGVSIPRSILVRADRVIE